VESAIQGVKVNVLEAAIKTKLTGTSSVTSLLATAASVFNVQIPDGYAFPVIVFNWQGGGDLNDTPTRAKEPLYQIKAISSVSMYQAGQIDDALDAVLHNVALTVSGWTNYWIARESDVRYGELTPAGHYFYHSGGIYRIGLSK